MNSELEKYYAGDEAWNSYSKMFCDEWENCNFKNELLNAFNGRHDIAMVIYGKMLNVSLKWAYQNVPALGNITPANCMDDKRTEKRLITMLMRMH